MLKACKYCGKIHDTHYDCKRKPVRSRGRAADSKSYYFRRSDTWTRKSQEIRERDGYLCQICIRKLYNTLRQFNYDTLSVHHIVPIHEDYDKRLDNDNLLTVCRMHHEMCEDGTISRREQLKIAKEQEQKGTPQGVTPENPEISRPDIAK